MLEIESDRNQGAVKDLCLASTSSGIFYFFRIVIWPPFTFDFFKLVFRLEAKIRVGLVCDLRQNFSSLSFYVFEVLSDLHFNFPLLVRVF